MGDAFMAAAGLPSPGENPVHQAADMALDIQRTVERMSSAFPDGLQVRIGLHTGPAVAGVIGHRKLFYDVWGEAVNTASRLESHGAPGHIQVTSVVKAELGAAYSFAPRGRIAMKGLGDIETWWLTGKIEAS